VSEICRCCGVGDGSVAAHEMESMSKQEVVKSDTDTDNGDGGDDPEDEEQKVVRNSIYLSVARTSGCISSETTIIHSSSLFRSLKGR